MEVAKASRDRGPDAPSNPCMVLVSGYPAYTQPQDLGRTFTQFGKVKIDKINQKFATLSFSNSMEAKSAIKESKRITIYGSFLTVQPHSAVAVENHNRQNNNRKREFPRSKEKGVIIHPKDIDLSGDFSQQVDNILLAIRLTQEEVLRISLLYSDLESALQTEWPGCAAIPFGSIPTGLGIKTSDADCFVKVPPQYRIPNVNFVNKATRILRQYPQIFSEILSIPRANTPIVKFFHNPTSTNCDVSFKTELGARNSVLINFLLRTDPRLIPMAVLIKYWARVHEVSGSGKVTNYALTMLIVFYLQQCTNPILPSIMWLQQDPKNDYIVDHWNTGFMSQLDGLPKSSNRSSISELIGGFFEYYAGFNFEEMVICPYLGEPVKKDLFKDPNNLPKGFERYRDNIKNQNTPGLRFTTSWCAQDPFEQCHNIASPVSSRHASNIKEYFRFASSAYIKDKPNKCENFLKMILLEKPKISKERGHPEFRSNLFPKFINNIIDPDWKSVVRNIILLIFESMLKIKLGKVEEKVNPDSKKEKEKYMGEVTKPIWKRKQASKMPGIMNLDLQQQQARITEEILKSELEQISIQFQMIMTYCHNPKRAVVSIKLNNGNIGTFKEFGKFFVSVLQSWFTHLLAPYTRSCNNDTAAKIAETIKFLDSNRDGYHCDSSSE
ncbi:speckle targeted PIP5K1A-regulated poly(A) polymerase-like [Achroia grisella]|uniref:speckle targeted PIP5K1A-regulated poly(A) polymerase-like n=1 Tax=Achroia grisella TaxID=688607 RepID=UPI0027D2820B|nr:speckle targeted PIP5K1A-regulated poly(A) polymerase-like [Achroia grisella]